MRTVEIADDMIRLGQLLQLAGWAEGGAEAKHFVADGEGHLADAMGLSRQIPGMGKRFARFAMIIVDGVVRDVFIQDVAGVTVSGAPAVLLALEARQNVSA